MVEWRQTDLEAADVEMLSLPLKRIRNEEHQSDRACFGEKAGEAWLRWSGHVQKRTGIYLEEDDDARVRPEVNRSEQCCLDESKKIN